MTIRELLEKPSKFKLYYFDEKEVLDFNTHYNFYLDYEVKESKKLTQGKTTAYKLPIIKENQDHAVFVRKVLNCTKCLRYPDCQFLPGQKNKEK